MYCILIDQKTKSYYMEPRKIEFFAYSSSSKREPQANSSAILVETTITDRKEFTTRAYNAGFTSGYIDGEHVYLTKDDAYFLSRNYNEVYFAQYLLTGDEAYLNSIAKKKLYSLCKITEEGAMFPTSKMADGTMAVLAYTDRQRIPQILFDKYSDGYRVVKMAFNVPVLVNSKFFYD